MPKAITDKNKINEVLTRGVEKIYPSREALEKVMLSGKRIRLYCGFDPSASSLHIGNAVLINKLAQFQALGHEVIFLIGDFTGMIGDPTDKSATRKKLTRKELLNNSRNYKRQASVFLRFNGDNPAKIMYNSQWGDKLTFKDLIEISSNFTVQQMIIRDMFQERLKAEKPIYLHEFLYPLAQAYDSVAMGVDLEIGGNDQMFNMMCGRSLVKIMLNKEKFVLTSKLLVDPSGKKMGKTEGNIVSLDETPENMYGQIMSWSDGLIGIGFELCTKVPSDKVKDIYEQLKDKKINPRDLKMKLAYEITRINHGQTKAKKAEEQFVKMFQKKELPDYIESMVTDKPKMNIIALLVDSKLASSKSEARRLIRGGGVKVNNNVVKDENKEIEIPKWEVNKKGAVIKKGKRQIITVSYKK